MPTSGITVRERLARLKDIDLGSAAASLFLASGARDDDVPLYQHAQVTDPVAMEFLEIYRLVREGFTEDTVLRPYDSGSKPDPHEVEYVPLAEMAEVAAQVEPLAHPTRLELFSADDEFVTGLRFYAISVQVRRELPVLAFRSYGRQRELGRSRSMGFLFRAGQFNEVRQPLFLFDQFLDCLVHDGMVFVLRQHDFQKLFRYYELVAAAAEQSLARIQQTIAVANFDEFAASCRGHVQKMAKLKNIAQRPYLEHVTMADLRRVIERFGLKVPIQDVNGTEMLVFDQSDRWAILRLLDDDYLESLMTEQLYEVTGKRVHQVV